jgi:hypothetical protein
VAIFFSGPAQRTTRCARVVISLTFRLRPSVGPSGVYRADVTLDDRVMWRGYVTIRQ